MSADVSDSRVMRDIVDKLDTPAPAVAGATDPYPVAAKGRHCWHGTGLTVSSLMEGGSMVTSDRCCFCGASRTTRYRRPRGHGGYAPSVHDGGYDYQNGVDPDACPHHRE